MTTNQEQVTVLEQWTQKGMRRWILRSDGKRIELPFKEWDAAPVIVVNHFEWPEPAEPECTAIVHLADKEKVLV